MHKNKFVLFLASILIYFTQYSYSQHIINDTTFTLNDVKVDIKTTGNFMRGVILVLPGWNFTQSDICVRSNFCKIATEKGYILIMPNMLKSIYALEKYPETRKDWIQYHTLYWLTDTLFPYLKSKFNLMNSSDLNYVLGISTGGRGVGMLSVYSKNIFTAGAALSGDFNPIDMPTDNLLRGYLGELDSFPERWKSTENPYANANKVAFPLLLAHAKADKVVPYEQSEKFYNALLVQSKQFNHKLSLVENMGHNYAFWQSEYELVFDFFDQNSSKKRPETYLIR